MMNENFYFLLINTPLSYPICLNEKEAINYLELILDKNFLYNNISNYDIIDYEKILYIEQEYKNNALIQNMVNELKQLIASGYKIKNQYKNRIIDMPKELPDNREIFNTEGYFGIPDNSHNHSK